MMVLENTIGSTGRGRNGNPQRIGGFSGEKRLAPCGGQRLGNHPNPPPWGRLLVSAAIRNRDLKLVGFFYTGGDKR